MKKVGNFFLGFVPFFAVIGIQYLAMAFIVGVAALFAYPIIPSNHSIQLGSLLYDTNLNTAIMVLYGVITAISFGIWYHCTCGGEFKPKKNTFHPMLVCSVIAFVPGAQFVCGIISTIVGTVVPKWMEQYESLLESAGLSDDITLLMIFYSVIIAPICEELVFRGVTMQIFKKAVPFWVANILQGILFGAFHMNWIQGFYAGCLGFLLGFVCEKGKSIYYSIILHFFFNLWGTVISSFLVFDENDIIPGLILIFIMILSLIVGSILFFFGTRLRNQKMTTQNA